VTARPRPLSRAEWNKTPYAKTTAGDPDGAIRRLLGAYGVAHLSLTSGRGPSGRPAFQVEFEFKSRVYRVMLETLYADAAPDQLMRQVQRAVYFRLKAVLEQVGVFCTAEEALFGYLKLSSGATAYEAGAAHIERLTAGVPRGLIALPPAKEPE
jgi:hypothetical protein